MQIGRLKLAVLGVAAVAILAMGRPAAATTVGIYDGFDSGANGFAFLNPFFTGKGYTVNPLASNFTSLAGIDYLIVTMPGGENGGTALSLSAAQLSAIGTFVNGGGHVVLQSDGQNFEPSQNAVNTILTSLGSTIVNADGTFDGGFHDTSNIAANPFTAGVHDVNYAFTSQLRGGTTLVTGVAGQVFIAYQGIGSGDVFVIADSNTANNISSSGTNDNGIMYCNFGGLSCRVGPAAVPEPASILLLGTGLVMGARRLRKSRRNG